MRVSRASSPRRRQADCRPKPSAERQPGTARACRHHAPDIPTPLDSRFRGNDGVEIGNGGGEIGNVRVEIGNVRREIGGGAIIAHFNRNANAPQPLTTNN